MKKKKELKERIKNIIISDRRSNEKNKYLKESEIIDSYGLSNGTMRH